MTDVEWLQPMLQVKGVRRFRIGIIRLWHDWRSGGWGWRDALVERLREAGNGVEVFEAGAPVPSLVHVCTFPMH